MPQNGLRYTRLSIFYFSGTGNARFSAHKIAGIAKAKGLDAKVYNITEVKHNYPAFAKDELIGFCYPTHGFNASPIVLKFIRHFPKGKNHVFLMNTRAGLKMGRMHTAGIGGMALWLPAIFLLLKGYKTIGFRPIDLPSNWISFHPGLTKKAINFIVYRCERTLSVFTEKILNGRTVLNGWLWLPVDIAVLPLTIGYYLVGRFALAKTFFASYRCNNCGLCRKNCPVQAIREIDNRPFWTFNCESCMKCMSNCPRRAIETAHGYSFLLWWIAFSLVPLTILKFLVDSGTITAGFLNRYMDIIYQVTAITTGLIVIFWGYKVLHRLLKYRWINKLITFTSLTHYKFWNRYKMPKKS